MATATTAKKSLAGLSKLATKKVTKPAKEVRQTWTFEKEPAFEKNLQTFLQIHTIAGEMEGVKKAREGTVKDTFLSRWVTEMWERGTQPENPRINVMFMDKDGVRQNIVDAECLFEVCKNKDGLKPYANTDNLDEDETIEEAVMKALMSPLVGLSQEKAMAFVHPENGEIKVFDCYNLADSIENLMSAESDDVRKATMKLVSWFQGGKETMEDEDTASILVATKGILIKDGFFERAKSYCANVDQLQKLIRFVRPKLVVKSVVFSEHDKTSRQHRLAETLNHFLAVE